MPHPADFDGTNNLPLANGSTLLFTGSVENKKQAFIFLKMDEASDQVINFPPPKYSWFEFLLDEGLLERHLNQQDPGKEVVSTKYYIIAHRFVFCIAPIRGQQARI